ncbi:hypothetical protein ACFVZC_26270 [Streptomyces marokkonensis]|uniref:Uncharacterized protein n=1 Tax=Streptomyces marokkonensis TaxID=324855 RepID=A0ABW6QCD6_9ACTN|nr:hypothetical protein [Streptomyces marokkonensis]
MLLLVLSAVLVVVVGGCACVVWAARGGPRWARGAARATLAAGELLRAGRPRGGSANGSDSGDD